MLNPVQIDNAKLAQALVEKHRRFIEGYQGEVNEIGSNLPGLRDTVSQAESKLEKARMRMDVLDEKRRLIYHHTSATESGESEILSRLSRCNASIEEEIRMVKDLSKPTANKVKEALQARQELESLQSQLPTLESNFEQAQQALQEAEERLNQLRAGITEHEAAARYWGDHGG